MRPLYLFIKGLGPYIEAEIKEEDFKTLTQNYLFLISGEIGAGKTSLFDAILYALYGDSGLSERKTRDWISHFIKSKPYTIPEVKFKFFLNGQIYQIIRRPPFRKTSEMSSLWIGNKLFSTKKQEINKKINELIGLNAHQFKKVFLIPQGKYREILLAKPEERKQLLEAIFEMEFYSLIEEYFKTSVKDLKNTINELNEKENYLKNLVQIPNLNNLETKIAEKQKILKDLESQKYKLMKEKNFLEIEIQKIEKIIEIWKNFKTWEKEFKKLTEKIPLYEKKKEKLERLKLIKEKKVFYENTKKLKNYCRNLVLRKQEIENSLTQLKEIKNDLSQKLNILNTKEPEIILKKEELEKLKNIKTLAHKKEKLEKEFQTITEKLKDKEEEYKKLISDLEDLKNHLEKFEIEREKVKNLILLLKEKEEIEKLLYKFKQYKKILKDKLQIEVKLKKIKFEYEELEKKKRELEVYYRGEELAQYLKPGKPCPICGSTEHPNPIKPGNYRDKLKIIEIELSKKKENLEQLQEKFFILCGRIKSIMEEIKEFSLNSLEEESKKINKELLNYKDLPYDTLKLKNIEENLNKNIKKIKTLIETKDQLQKNLENEIKKLRDSYGVLKGSLKEIKNLLQKEYSLKEIENKLAKLEAEISNWEEEKTKLEENLINVNQKEIKLLTEKENLKFQLKDKLKEYKTNFQEIYKLIKDGILPSIKEFRYFLKKIEDIKKLENEIKVFEEHFNIAKTNFEFFKNSLEKISLHNIEDFEVIKPNLENLKLKKQKIETKINFITQRIGSITQEVDQLYNIFQEYKKLKKEKEKLEKEYKILEHLNQVIIGKNPRGISFRSFVLSIFMDLILKRANFYFEKFSFGRYRFIEEKFLQKNLSLEIFDNYTGMSREVKTLSGGESFIATLALALGTSDVIIKLSHAKTFESLFIDEGFGSLDSSTLEKVIHILLNLAHTSGRIIGIISHLEELKEKFPIILEVCKNPQSGSKLKIVKRG